MVILSLVVILPLVVILSLVVISTLLLLLCCWWCWCWWWCRVSSSLVSELVFLFSRFLATLRSRTARNVARVSRPPVTPQKGLLPHSTPARHPLAILNRPTLNAKHAHAHTPVSGRLHWTVLSIPLHVSLSLSLSLPLSRLLHIYCATTSKKTNLKTQTQ